MRSSRWIRLTLFLLSAGCVTAAIIFSPVEIDKTVDFTPGMSAREFAGILKQEGVLRFETPFLIYLKLTGADRRLKPGKHELAGIRCFATLASELQRERTLLIKITVPEGLTLALTATLLEKQGCGASGSFIAASGRAGFYANNLPDLGMIPATLEGFLFPETYHFRPGESREVVIRTMLNQFSRALARVSGDKTTFLGTFESVVLASIIEREAVVDAEKSRISGVFHNRLRKKMALESCATVLYALGTHKERLLLEDLKIKSEYNTYMHAGLPPGPICSPGEKSLYAAMHPESHDYLYFISEGNTHHFSRSLSEHLQWKKKLKKSN
ncbi:MAG: endolytic transglycosylase MltG [Candidatus Wallbacteria bacterium]|nr:endolytic transglycosylase MltG [Candidatus Wallbacteria bacterium]